MRLKILLSTIGLLIFLPFVVTAQSPKLIVGITIRQMRYDYLSRYFDKFGNDGFKRLFNNGSYCRDAEYDYLITESSPGYATIVTGSNPSEHGIIADDWYVSLSHKSVNCVYDDQYKAVGSSSHTGEVSPKQLIGSTFGDELRLATFKRSKVFSVSIDPQAAVIQSGKLGNAAYWFDYQEGKWITCDYYMKTLPQWVTDFNNKKFPDIYLDRGWYPLKNQSDYVSSLPDNSIYEIGIRGQNTFPYNLKTLSINQGYSLLKYTPFGNTFTKDFALECISSEQLGKDNFTDLLLIDFSATGYAGDIFGIRSVEMEDIFIRLDADLAHLLNSLDEFIGKDNYIVYLTSDRGAVDSRVFLEEIGVEVGSIDINSSVVVLNTYLKALYGNYKWVEKYSDRQIYLNRNLIEDKKISLDEIQDKTAEFMVQFAGIDNAAPAHAFRNMHFTTGMWAKAENSYNRKRSGDVLINLAPGWQEVNDDGSAVSLSASKSGYNQSTHVPLVFYGAGIKKADIYKKVSITDIAATLSLFSGICRPEYASGSAVMER